MTLSSNWHLILRLTVFEISRSNGQNSGPKFRILGTLGVPPPNGKICPRSICTIVQNFTLIGATVAEILSPDREITQQPIRRVTTTYSVSQKNVPSLTGYSFNTYPPIFTFLHMSSTDIQRLSTGITFSTTSLLLTLFCSLFFLHYTSCVVRVI